MATLTDEMKAVFAKNRIFSFATASLDGTPNVAPMSMVELIGDDTLWIGDNYMAKTLANVMENPRGALFFWDPDDKHCFQIKGSVAVKTSGPEYEQMRAKIKAKGAHYPAKGLLVLTVTAVFQCSPGNGAGQACA
ncbi:pyridoxamine 5'-phosphate oxidase family protein [Methylotetracoccus oryzae]|uniref:pyridoxamine 5'-phosphate oxidase family protein n=1 Tax=Methylotetracoccus oryzae TaxID=1919059 RepID=UPI00111B5841|nr:pyridoxamine 5'-phosphate oxidase family protein [Methylotetracoccus oryzae]